MAWRIQTDLNEVDWNDMASLYTATLGKREPHQLRRAFENSFLTVLVRDNQKLIGAGRVISDGEYYANVYDVVVLPDYQNKGVGSVIMHNLLERIGHRFVLLTTTIGKEPFYRKFGFRKHKTAMAIYPPSKQDRAELYLED